MTKPLEFWFEFASTYSYPAAMRIEAVCQSEGVPLRWRPFLLGPVLAGLGMMDSPFNLNPVKGAYMWQDLARICAQDGLTFRKPSVFPRGSLLGARVVMAHAEAPWVADFIRQIFIANFAKDADIGSIEVVSEILKDLGLDPDPVLAATVTPEVKAALKAQTSRAVELDIFGSPTLIVGGELYWGNDRIEMAVARAKAG